MIRKKLKFRIIVISMISVGLLGCTNQNLKEVVNDTTTSAPRSAEINKIAQATSITSSHEADKTQAEQQTAQVPGTTNSTEKKLVEETFYGQWKIEKFLAFGPVGTYSDDDIKTMVGRRLFFSNERSSCFGDTIDYLNNTAINPVYKKSVISKNDFEANNRITFDKLGVKGDVITEIDATDAKGNGCTFFIKDNNTLILFGGGVYFELNRI